jgi:hypothetical protein
MAGGCYRRGVTPPPYGPPSMVPFPSVPPFPQQPVRRSHTLRNVLIIVGVVVVLCCGGGITAGVWLFNRGLSDLKPAEDTTNAFVSDLESDRYSAAYGLLCASARADFTLDRFSQGVQSQPHIRGHRGIRAYVNDFNGHLSATVTEELTEDNGFVQTHTFPLLKEDGAWRVCGRPY